MITIITCVFLVGIIAIMFEHKLHVDKTAVALMTALIIWVLYFKVEPNHVVLQNSLIHYVGEISEILFFLLGAMGLVELIDSHGGFELITKKLYVSDKGKLLWTIALLSFSLSAVIDSLTTAIIMVTLIQKILVKKEDKIAFCGIIIIASNAGGAWSPLGNVTTTMLWIGGQITVGSIMLHLILPSLAVAAVPTWLMARKYKNKKLEGAFDRSYQVTKDEKIVLLCGVLCFIGIPVFTVTTEMPPFIGMLGALAVMWIIIQWLHKNKDDVTQNRYSVTQALQKVNISTLLFLLGILLAISGLEELHVLSLFSDVLNHYVGNLFFIPVILGFISALIDNVPLMAAVQGMYPLTQFAINHPFWNFMALATGTGGSILIIGSAAGVAIMGLEKINFFEYLKKISLYAILGYVMGIVVFFLQSKIF